MHTPLLKSLKNILYRNNSVDTSVFSVFSSSPSFFTIKDICMKMGAVFLNPSPGIWVSSAALPMRSFPPCMTSRPWGRCWRTVAVGQPLDLSSLPPWEGLLGVKYVSDAMQAQCTEGLMCMCMELYLFCNMRQKPPPGKTPHPPHQDPRLSGME